MTSSSESSSSSSSSFCSALIGKNVSYCVKSTGKCRASRKTTSKDSCGDSYDGGEASDCSESSDVECHQATCGATVSTSRSGGCSNKSRTTSGESLEQCTVKSSGTSSSSHSQSTSRYSGNEPRCQGARRSARRKDPERSECSSDDDDDDDDDAVKLTKPCNGGKRTAERSGCSDDSDQDDNCCTDQRKCSGRRTRATKNKGRYNDNSSEDDQPAAGGKGRSCEGGTCSLKARKCGRESGRCEQKDTRSIIDCLPEDGGKCGRVCATKELSSWTGASKINASMCTLNRSTNTRYTYSRGTAAQSRSTRSYPEQYDDVKTPCVGVCRTGPATSPFTARALGSAPCSRIATSESIEACAARHRRELRAEFASALRFARSSTIDTVSSRPSTVTFDLCRDDDKKKLNVARPLSTAQSNRISGVSYRDSGRFSCSSEPNNARPPQGDPVAMCNWSPADEATRYGGGSSLCQTKEIVQKGGCGIVSTCARRVCQRSDKMCDIDPAECLCKAADRIECSSEVDLFVKDHRCRDTIKPTKRVECSSSELQRPRPSLRRRKSAKPSLRKKRSIDSDCGTTTLTGHNHRHHSSHDSSRALPRNVDHLMEKIAALKSDLQVIEKFVSACEQKKYVKERLQCLGPSSGCVGRNATATCSGFGPVRPSCGISGRNTVNCSESNRNWNASGGRSSPTDSSESDDEEEEEEDEGEEEYLVEEEDGENKDGNLNETGEEEVELGQKEEGDKEGDDADDEEDDEEGDEDSDHEVENKREEEEKHSSLFAAPVSYMRKTARETDNVHSVMNVSCRANIRESLNYQGANNDWDVGRFAEDERVDACDNLQHSSTSAASYEGIAATTFARTIADNRGKHMTPIQNNACFSSGIRTLSSSQKSNAGYTPVSSVCYHQKSAEWHNSDSRNHSSYSTNLVDLSNGSSTLTSKGSLKNSSNAYRGNEVASRNCHMTSNTNELSNYCSNAGGQNDNRNMGNSGKQNPSSFVRAKTENISSNSNQRNSSSNAAPKTPAAKEESESDSEEEDEDEDAESEDDGGKDDESSGSEESSDSGKSDEDEEDNASQHSNKAESPRNSANEWEGYGNKVVNSATVVDGEDGETPAIPSPQPAKRRESLAGKDKQGKSVPGSPSMMGPPPKGKNDAKSGSKGKNNDDEEEDVGDYTLKNFPTNVARAIFASIKEKLDESVETNPADAQALQVIKQNAELEIETNVLPILVEHITWRIKQELNLSVEQMFEYDDVLDQDVGVFTDQVAVSVTLETHTSDVPKRKYAKSFTVSSNNLCL